MMNSYKIQTKAKSLASLSPMLIDSKTEPYINIDGYIIKNWNDTLSPFQNLWIEKEIKWENWGKAYHTFVVGLYPIINRLSFVSQCEIDFFKQPFLIEKIGDNDWVFYVFLVNNKEEWGLLLQKEELEDYNKLKTLNNYFFEYMLSYTVADNRFLKIFALCGAVDSFSTGKTRKSIRKDILWKKLADKLFQQEIWIRHKLLHGDFTLVDSKIWNLEEQVYEKILAYLNRTYKVNLGYSMCLANSWLDNKKKYIPRNFNWYLKGWWMFLKKRNTNLPANLKDIPDDWEKYIFYDKECQFDLIKEDMKWY